MSDFAFVRRETLPELPPPPSEQGIVKWSRENLFSGWFNSILTILSVLIIGWMLLSILPWFSHSVWNAGSLRECREVGEGACFAVINERLWQFVFGFYPSELYWRPILAFVLLLVALAPVLYPELPRWMLWHTAAYPAIAFFLIWGGTIWGPLLVLAGFVLGYYAFKYGTEMVSGLVGLIAAILVPVLWWLLMVDTLSSVLADALPIGLEVIQSDKLGGFLLSVIIGVAGIAASLPLGILLALGRQSPMVFVSSICVTFIECMRGVPLITLLFVASTLLNYFLPPGSNFDIILRVVIMVTFFAAAYMAEVVRGGLAALPKGQYEAADSLGLDYWKSMQLIILPQALKISIPGIVSNFIGLFKDTTLVSQISLFDPIGILNPIRADANWNGIVWELYGFVALFFFIFCFGMSRYSMALEKRLATDHR